MDVQDLRKLLEKSDDKLKILDDETLNKYSGSIFDLAELLRDFLSDEEKLKLFDYPLFQFFVERDAIRTIISMVANERIELQMLTNDKFIESMGFIDKSIYVSCMSDNGKIQFLYRGDLIKKFKITPYDISSIFSSCSEETKTKILLDTKLTREILKLSNEQIIELVAKLSDVEAKVNTMKKYQFKKYDIIDILKRLDIKTLREFFKNHKKFCSENGIHPYEIIWELDTKKQEEFVWGLDLENDNLTSNEIMEILAVLDADIKQKIMDTTDLPEKYKLALSMEKNENSILGLWGEDKHKGIIIDWERDLEDYRGLDNLIAIFPPELPEEKKNKFIKLCDICPNMKIGNDRELRAFYSSVTEYKEAEEWIESIIGSLKPEYSDAQKIAVIDNAIGKKISYSPDFDTEVFNPSDSKALWKIISSGYGTCEGIALVEHYMLSRVGIKSEIIKGEGHAFLKINDLEVPLANGTTVRGNTIVDPTWNLAEHRFGAMPSIFCTSYQKAREEDINIKEKDTNSHKNDEELQDATLDLDDKSLRKLFTSVGLADKDGRLPKEKLAIDSKIAHQTYANQPEKNIEKQFEILRNACPEFATCQRSSIQILSLLLLKDENLRFNRCVVNRVYNRADKDKRAILFVYIDSNELGKRFYVADKEEGQFVALSQEEFVKQFECYETDIKTNSGRRLWETEEEVKQKEDSEGELETA